MTELKPFDFGQMLPGFEFLQKLAASGAGATGPAAWALPTVDVEELDKRITELKAVQFWLEQNLVALKATVQALEVQKMTLTALRSMNLGMGEIARAFTLPTEDGVAEEAAEAPAPAAGQGASNWPYKGEAAPQEAAPEPSADAAASGQAPEAEPDRAPRRASRSRTTAPAAAAEPAATVSDPMQWWGALTQQFQQIAAEALHGAAHAMPMADAGTAEPAPAAPAKAQRGAAAKKKPAAKKKAAPRKKAAAARKSTARKAAAPKPEAPETPGWPLPTPFRFGRS